MRVCSSLFLLCWLTSAVTSFGASIHYLDCKAGNDSADSLTQEAAWRTLAKASSYKYLPGDSLLLRRGGRCEGMLWPKGSGTEQAPIHLGAYGAGPLPTVAGGAESAGLRLNNQQYWEIENLEVIGGTPYGIHIGGDTPVMRHFRITNVVVHDVPGTPISKDTGLVVIAPDDNAKSRFDDVIIDGVSAYQTSEWAGIIVNGAGFDSTDGDEYGDHIEIRNSMVHDVAGDGILLARVSHGVLEHNVAWYTGMQQKETIGTPNAIWEWRCRDCRVEFNEGYFTDSPGVDGGVFDIDYGDENNVLRHNFGHDSQGYCVSVFGAEGTSGNSVHNEIRENTCIHNGRSPRLAKRQGAVFLYTWNGGRLNGIEIADNRIVWDSPVRVAAFQSTADFVGELPNRFAGNTIIAASPPFVASKVGVQFSGNHYCAPKAPASEQSDLDPAANSPQELCACVGQLLRDTRGGGLHASFSKPADLAGRWLLATVMSAPEESRAEASRSQLVLMESMMHQFADLGLSSVIVPARPLTPSEAQQWRTDWNIDPEIRIDASNALGLRRDGSEGTAPLLLLSPAGEVVANWQYPVPPADVWLQIQSRIGAPDGAQKMPICHSVADIQSY